MNQIIREFYIDHGTLKDGFSIDTTPKTILKELTKTGVKYTWETVKDERIDNIQSVIEVRVYLPGYILYGRHIYKTADASDAHLYAISEAVKLIVPEYEDIKYTETKEEKMEDKQLQQTFQQPSSTNQPLSQEEIINMIQQQQNTKITTAEQFNNETREEIPFEDVNLEMEELDNLLFGNNKKVYQQQTEEVKQQNQQPVSHGFSQEQINAIVEFKKRMNITNDALLCSYINSWNSKLSKKEDLNANNIDEFIKWTKSVGKAPC